MTGGAAVPPVLVVRLLAHYEAATTFLKERRAGTQPRRRRHRRKTITVTQTTHGRTHERISWFASYLGVDVKTVKRWIERGLLPQSIKPNSRITLLPVAQTMAAVERLRAGGES